MTMNVRIVTLVGRRGLRNLNITLSSPPITIAWRAGCLASHRLYAKAHGQLGDQMESERTKKTAIV
jgi:hypothetical protein